MLFVLFQVGSDQYAVPASRVIEVLPLVLFKRIPQSPRGVAGAFNYRGTAVPVVDLNDMLLGTPAAERLSTRVLLVRYPMEAGTEKILGLIAERATETLRRDESDFAEPGITPSGMSCLGRVCKGPHGLIQWVEVENLLTPEMRDLLFHQPA